MEQALLRVTDAQKSHYNHEGYVLIRKLIPENVVVKAEKAMRRVIQNHAGSTTESENPLLLYVPAEEAEFIAIFDLQFRLTAAHLASGDPEMFTVPRQPWALVVFPKGKEWQWPEPHIDHALEEDHFKIFPPPFRIASISYLSDVPQHGGGTVIWPRSHKILTAFVKKNRRSYRYMSDLNRILPTIRLNPPVELKPSRGDVLFYHYLCAHSAGMNVSDVTRLAIGKKW